MNNEEKLELCEILIEDTRIINFESLETNNLEDVNHLCKQIKEVLGDDYIVSGKKDKRNVIYQIGVYSIVENNALILSFSGKFYFDYFLYGYWKAAVEEEMKRINRKNNISKAN